MEPLAVNRPDITHLNQILNAMGPIIPSSLNEPTLIYCPIPLTFLAWMVACYAYIKSCPIMNISPCHSLPPCVEKSPDKSSHFIASQNSRSTQGGWQEGPAPLPIFCTINTSVFNTCTIKVCDSFSWPFSWDLRGTTDRVRVSS